ncbi:MAG TPA: hypothetical protein VNC12_03220 [Solirubrobacteraceae bacterium]|nr:hypothetical protein [Solirubrobacteraceae bacterium]
MFEASTARSCAIAASAAIPLRSVTLLYSAIRHSPDAADPSEILIGESS